MANICEICGKKPVLGRSLTYRGVAKKKGGVGKKITGNPKRRFLPNIQRVKAMMDGAARYIKVCAGCIRANLVIKA